MPAVGLALLLCLPSTLGAAHQDSPADGDRQSPAQSPRTHSGSRQKGCGSQGEADRLTSQRACIVDLKPGDLRLFAPSASTPGKLHRWLDLQAAAVGIQYLFVKNGLGVTIANQQQYQVATRGRFKLDAKGRFAINAGLSTGTNFIAGFNNTGLGVGKARSNLYLKHLYFSAVPVDGIEVQYGGLDIWHDESTDITGYGYSGYVVGERVSIKRPREFFFDDISVAYGYVGDLNLPNVIRRAHRLTQSNFHRFMLKKDFGERAWISADYAFQSGVPTWREAIRIRIVELRAIDTFHAELYQISRPYSGYGFAAYVEKMVHPKFVVGGGYSDIDRPMLNSDRYGRGKRLFVTTKIPISGAFSILIFATQATNHSATNVPQQRLDIGLYYNVLDLLRRTGLF
jgi:hypothetical protein